MKNHPICPSCKTWETMAGTNDGVIYCITCGFRTNKKEIYEFMADNDLIVDVEEPKPPAQPDNGPRLTWLGAIFLGIALVGLALCFILPVSFVWIGVLAMGVGVLSLILWAVFKK